MNQLTPPLDGTAPDSVLLRSLCDPAEDERALDTVIDTGAFELAENAKMGALLAHRVRATPTTHGAALQQLAAEALRKAEHRSLLQRAAAVEAVAALARAGIAAAALNGTALNGRLYPPPTRPGTDVDLLITPGATPAALVVLTELGYDEPARTETARRKPTGDPLLPRLTVDLADRLQHTENPEQIRAALAMAGAHPDVPQLPTLAARDELAHALARAADRPRWLTYADALRLAHVAPTHPQHLDLPERALTGWTQISALWPTLLQHRAETAP
jgi:hypothetical protein